jgi:hypothetical protein
MLDRRASSGRKKVWPPLISGGGPWGRRAAGVPLSGLSQHRWIIRGERALGHAAMAPPLGLGAPPPCVRWRKELREGDVESRVVRSFRDGWIGLTPRFIRPEPLDLDPKALIAYQFNECRSNLGRRSEIERPKCVDTPSAEQLGK